MAELRSDRFSGCCVLVVEGDTKIACDLRDKLGTVGCEVSCESSCRGIQQHKDLASFSAVFIDRSFIDDVLPQVQTAAPLVPVIVTSGESDVRGAVTAIRQGATDYLLKPAQPSELEATLVHALERREATEAYQREKAFSDNLLDLVPAIVLVLDAQGRIVRFNRFMEQLSGYRLEEMKGRDWFDTFLSEQDRPHGREAVQKVASGGMVSGNVNPTDQASDRSSPRQH